MGSRISIGSLTSAWREAIQRVRSRPKDRHARRRSRNVPKPDQPLQQQGWSKGVLVASLAISISLEEHRATFLTLQRLQAVNADFLGCLVLSPSAAMRLGIALGTLRRCMRYRVQYGANVIHVCIPRVFKSASCRDVRKGNRSESLL
jgi:hypothetical protein